MLVGTKKNQQVTGFVPDDGNEYFFPYLIMGTSTLRIVMAIRTINNENALTMTLVIELTKIRIDASQTEGRSNNILVPIDAYYNNVLT